MLAPDKLDELYKDLFILGRWKIVNDELDYIEQHNSLVEKAMLVKAKLLENEMWESLEGSNCPEEEQYIVERYGAEFYENDNMYPSFHRCSMLISLYSFLETTLAFYCKILGKHFLKSSFKIPQGSIIRQRKWLEEKVGANFQFCNSEWLELNNFRLLRNSIVHSFGDIGINDKLANYIQNSPHLEFSEHGIGYCHTSGDGFDIFDGFFNHVILTLKNFFKKLSLGLSHLFPHDEQTIGKMISEHYDCGGQAIYEL